MSYLDESELLFLSVKDRIRDAYPEVYGKLAFGAAGSGSEFGGFEDEVSRDHDYSSGFCVFVSDEDDILFGPRLLRLYRELAPSSFEARSAMGARKLGVIRTSDFYMSHLGTPSAPVSAEQWLYLQPYSLFEASNGRVFEDNLGQFSAEREKVLHGMPEDVRKKKIAARCALAAQSGQYNYSRCLAHGEKGAAALALGEFVKQTAELVFLLNRAHMPYYKWMFRAMSSLDILPEMKERLEAILLNGGSGCEDEIELTAALAAEELRRQGLSTSQSAFLEDHAFSVMNTIEDRNIRTMHVMEG